MSVFKAHVSLDEFMNLNPAWRQQIEADGGEVVLDLTLQGIRREGRYVKDCDEIAARRSHEDWWN